MCCVDVNGINVLRQFCVLCGRAVVQGRGERMRVTGLSGVGAAETRSSM